MKHFKRMAAAALAGLMMAGTAVSLPMTATAAQEGTATYNGTPITKHEGGYDYDFSERKVVTRLYDFSMEQITYYESDPAVALGSEPGTIVDGALTTKKGKDCVFGSAVSLGDEYGLEDGYLSFDMKLTGGTVYLGVRTSRTASDSTKRGIWFTFDGSDSMKIFEPECGLEATVPMPVKLNEAKKFVLQDKGDTLTLASGDTVIAVIRYSEEGYLAFCDGSGAVKAETTECELYPTGYFSLHLKDITGYVDNMVFTNVEETWEIPTAESIRTIDYSTWTATDALDRTVADNAKAGDPKDNRYVGLFYFICSVGGGIHVQDNSKIYLELGAENALEYLDKYGFEAYWAEPYFGYYRNTDTWVYRKHGYMLEQAGVDFIYLDVSNAVVFADAHMALFDTWLEMRREGIDTPQIIFFNGDKPSTFQSNMTTLFTTVYSDANWDKYEELFFKWNGKVLTFGNDSEMTGEVKKKVEEKFTVRGSWAWTDKDNYWPWLQEYVIRGNRVHLQNGGWGRDAKGKYEALTVAIGHHATTGKGRSYVNGVSPDNQKGDMEFSSVERAAKGLGFENAFKAVQMLVDARVRDDQPFVMMITGWNEWIAGCGHVDTPTNMANTMSTFYFVDQFNCEYSRDAEPMRNSEGYGLGDNFYYQMVDYIRQYKGISATPVADHQTSLNIYDLSEWDDIEMTYMDSVYDVEHRNTLCYDADFRYINNTGRNDFEYAKVSQDEDNLYFLVKTTHDLIIDNNTEWMNLYINVDGDNATGWEGYDYILNRDRDSFVVTVEKFKDNTFETEVVGGAYYYTKGAYMTIRLPKDLMGVSGKVDKMIFKWADNSVNNGDPMAFMDLGDTAPDNRFGFLYLCEDYTTKSVEKTVLTTDTVKTAANGTSVEQPDVDMKINVKDVKVDVMYSVDDFVAGTTVRNTPMSEHFQMVGTTQVVKGTEGNFLRIQGFSDLRTLSELGGAYEFSTDLHMVDYGNSAVYLRGEMPGAYRVTNPANAGVSQSFPYYEWDWYAENGGTKYGGSSTAGSGIGLYPEKDAITVRIKRYAEDGLGVASASYRFPYVEGFRPDENGWFNLHVVDDGSTVSIYFNDALMCSVQLQEPGVVYPTDKTDQEYFGKVVLCDATGAEVLTVVNTRVNSEGSQIAFTTRAQTMEFDNVYITYNTQEFEGGLVETVLGGSEMQTDYTPDQSLVITLNLGNVLGDEQESTSAEETTVQTPESNSPDSGQETDPPAKKGCRSVLPLPALMTLLGMSMFLCRKKE